MDTQLTTEKLAKIEAIITERKRFAGDKKFGFLPGIVLEPSQELYNDFGAALQATNVK